MTGKRKEQILNQVQDDGGGAQDDGNNTGEDGKIREFTGEYGRAMGGYGRDTGLEKRLISNFSNLTIWQYINFYLFFLSWGLDFFQFLFQNFLLIKLALDREEK